MAPNLTPRQRFYLVALVPVTLSLVGIHQLLAWWVEHKLLLAPFLILAPLLVPVVRWVGLGLARLGVRDIWEDAVETYRLQRAYGSAVLTSIWEVVTSLPAMIVDLRLSQEAERARKEKLAGHPKKK